MMRSLTNIPKVALAGSVGSSRRTLLGLIRHRLPIVGILGLSPLKSSNVSGYCRLDDLALSVGVPYVEFEKINHPDIVRVVREWSPDILFVIGLSQIVKRDLLSIPRLGCIGFHPTWLPEGRGRAPVAWLTLEGRPGAATFFLMDEEADSGPILVQEPFFVSDRDFAQDVIEKMELAIDRALDRWLPLLAEGKWEPIPQKHEMASYYGRRGPEDGLIQWEWSAKEIHALIRGASRPHPGAYTYLEGHRLIIWRSEIELSWSYHGVVGRILCEDDSKGWLIQTGGGLLWITDVEFVTPLNRSLSSMLRVGVKLGYSPQDEIHLLKKRMQEIELRLSKLES